MEKTTVKAVTRLQKFLAAIAGDGVAPNPITDQEKLLHNIAENVNNGGGSGGGGVEIVRFDKSKFEDSNTEGRCDHTLDELIQAYAAGKDVLCYISDYNGFNTPLGILMVSDDPQSSYAITPTFMYGDETKNYKISVFMNADGVSVTKAEVQ
jgi:thiamine pyrophosphokinase